MDVRPEDPDDYWAVEALYDLCFAPGRQALSSYRLRDTVPPISDLSFVAPTKSDIDGQPHQIGGVIRYWPVKVGRHSSLLLGPVAVHPTRQGEGVGSFLIQASLAKAIDLNWTRVLLVGDAPYYRRFGFEILENVTMPPPTNPKRVLGLGNWHGVYGAVTAWPSGETIKPG